MQPAAEQVDDGDPVGRRPAARVEREQYRLPLPRGHRREVADALSERDEPPRLLGLHLERGPVVGHEGGDGVPAERQQLVEVLDHATPEVHLPRP